VFFDPGTAVIENGGAVDPAALRSLRHLVDAGHELVLVDPPDESAGDLRELAARVVDAVSQMPDGRAWYLTNDVEHCREMTARVRTVLIGASPPPGSIHRCDSVARDLQAAVMEILASEAMSAERP
jgi:23S rRNA A2030 N6-methylase RlmJ